MSVQITLPECGWDIQDDRNTSSEVVGKNIVVQDPRSGLVVIIPLELDVAREWAAKLDDRPAVVKVGHIPGVSEEQLRSGSAPVLLDSRR